MIRHSLSFALALTLGAGAALAQGAPAPDLSGSVRLGYWSSTRDLDDREPLGGGMVWLKARAPVPGGASLFAEGWGALRGPPEDGDASAELREAYLTATFGSLDLRLGRQIVAWGRADGINPTGNLAAEDLTLLTLEDGDRRLGTTTAAATWYFGDVAVSGLWIPEFRGHRFPLPAAGGALFVRDVREWPGDQWALRVERTGGAVDWSASFYRGLDLSPDLVPTTAPGRIGLRHRRISVTGLDAAATVGRFGVRAEGAYVQTEDEDGTDPFAKNPFAFFVVGGDRTWDGRINLNLQYLARVVTRFRPIPAGLPADARALAEQQAVLSGQAERVQHGASVRASVKWWRETVETEWAAVAYAGPRGIVMRPKASYAASDRVLVTVGAEVFRGSDGSLFRALRPNSAGFAEVRWGF